jgi:signal transduction histidine kinase
MWNGALAGQRVQAALVDADGQVLIGSLRKNVPQAVRAAAATGLPWTLQVTSTDAGADQAGFAGRRRLLLSGFAVLALVVLAGSYFILRSISREIAVAGLQSEFVATVSHEFRTPLTSLRQLSEMLSKGRVPTEELRQQSYDILAHESERLQRLVESLLDFGRMEARAVRYQFQDVDPSALVGDVVTEFREKAAALGHQVELARDGAYPLIRADREALALALWNLLDNAVKYSPDQRTIWWRWRASAPAWPSACATGASEFRPPSRRRFSRNSSAAPPLGPPVSKAPASASPWCATSSRRTAARSGWRANRARAARLPSCCPVAARPYRSVE